MALDTANISRLFIPALVQGLKLDQRLVDATNEASEQEIYSTLYHPIVPIYIAFGEKPSNLADH